MNRNAIKSFATWARGYLMEQVALRLAKFGITPKALEEFKPVAGGVLVAGNILEGEDARHYSVMREYIEGLPQKSLAEKVCFLNDEMAYTWFNRLVALRYMEVNGYITTRVLSSSDERMIDPDILREAGEIAELGDIEGLNPARLGQWREEGANSSNPDEYVYRRLLLCQCEALGESLPFLFDRNKSYLSLFLPSNLLNQDSIIGKLVGGIDEGEWLAKGVEEEDSQDVEIIGWLYQFYISERKDEVIGAKSQVKAADIPAATQLFTPHWIVRYMVENSLGRLWLEARPQSGLRRYMKYYLEGKEPGESLGAKVMKPQELTVCDPACGSGHILVYAFTLLVHIYREEGYSDREIPELILTHNLHGLDIDQRAAQLTSFALLMKGRAIDKRILRRGVRLNVTAVVPTYRRMLPGVSELVGDDWYGLLDAFIDADNLGSLITPPKVNFALLREQLESFRLNNPALASQGKVLEQVLLQGELLSQQYWAVIANPPYMGSKSLNPVLKNFASQYYPDSKSDVFAMFIERLNQWTHQNSYLGLITPFVWMFISSYETLREKIINSFTITSLIQLEYNAFEPACIPVCTFTLKKPANKEELGTYIKLSYFKGHQNQAPKTLEAIGNPNCGYLYHAKSVDFAKIPGSAIAYWVSKKILNIFEKFESLDVLAEPRKGMVTADNPRFIRFWAEVRFKKIGFNIENRKQALDSHSTWFPYQKGGDFRNWYGNHDWVVDWENDGFRLLNMQSEGYKTGSTNHNLNYIFKSALIWSKVTSSKPSFRYSNKGFLFDDASGLCSVNDKNNEPAILGFLCSCISCLILSIVNPTLNIQPGNIASIPIKLSICNKTINDLVEKCLTISRQDWDNFETSWDFQTHPLLRYKTPSLEIAFNQWQEESEQAFQQLKQLEEENNKYWIEAYGLQDELTPEVPDEQITIRRADLPRDIRSLISYGVGCIMGRYSLDKPGLIHAGQPFDPDLHSTFPADGDAIIPITEKAYFEDDILNQFLKFLEIAYSPETLSENLKYIANALTIKNNESPLERLRRYFTSEFISDHIKTYKKRPIYWLFTSGKKRAFSGLIYLHRYDETTLARLRTDYVLPLQMKLDAEIKRVGQELDIATATAAKKQAQKTLKNLQEQQAELREYQAKLQNFADRRITLDLDDGVAYNYSRFKGIIYEGADLKMSDLEKAAAWKLNLNS